MIDWETIRYRSIFRTYVIDDEWHLLKEVVKRIDICIKEARADALRRVFKQNREHKGLWLDAKVAERYAAYAMVPLAINGNQYINEVRKLGEELQNEYGVTEIEAINILNDENVEDYINNYFRIKNLIPNYVDEQAISIK